MSNVHNRKVTINKERLILRRMFKNGIKYLLVALVLASCVSQKKYKSLQEQTNQLAVEKGLAEDVLNKLSVENDSLKKENELLDSLLRIEREKNAIAGGGKRDLGLPKPKKKSTLSKEEEYDKKALFLYNFTSYVSWSKFNGASFKIALAGESPILQFLTNYTKGKKFIKVPFEIVNYVPGQEYQIIFISNAASKNFAKIKSDVGKKNTLIVTENTLFDKMGGHISFYIDGDKVNFLVNKPAIEKAGLNVSSKLVKFSEN